MQSLTIEVHTNSPRRSGKTEKQRGTKTMKYLTRTKGF